jgi:hypothetical protein
LPIDLVVLVAVLVALYDAARGEIKPDVPEQAAT